MNQVYEIPIQLDPNKIKFDLPPNEAFRLTEVRSIESYERLKNSLPKLRGISYLFINVLDGIARLILTIIVAEDLEVTSTYVLDHESFDLSYDELVLAVEASSLDDGNYPISSVIEKKIRSSIETRWATKGTILKATNKF